MSTQCSVSLQCKNSIDKAGDKLAKCSLCRLAPENLGRDTGHFWNPINSKDKHPLLLEEKKQKKFLKHRLVLQKKASRDKDKRKISRLASNAERTTEKQIIRSTKNSGRFNKDGDHVAFDSITLDTKLQTTRSNPIINMLELDKVREDAKRAGTYLGGLVIRNKHGVGCIVFREEDFAKGLEWIRKSGT